MKKSPLALNIRKLRLFKQLNQTEFAEKLSVTRASIGAYEEGRAEPKLAFLIELSDFFKLSIDQIVKKELTINEIAKFPADNIPSSSFDKVHEKLDQLALEIKLINQKFDNQ